MHPDGFDGYVFRLNSYAYPNARAVDRVHVRYVRPGDVLSLDTTPTYVAEVEEVVETPLETGDQLVPIGDASSLCVYMTPNHPVLLKHDDGTRRCVPAKDHPHASRPAPSSTVGVRSVFSVRMRNPTRVDGPILLHGPSRPSEHNTPSPRSVALLYRVRVAMANFPNAFDPLCLLAGNVG